MLSIASTLRPLVRCAALALLGVALSAYGQAIAGDPLALPKEDFAAMLRGPLRKTVKTHGLEVEVAYVADAYLYQMAHGLNELRASKLEGKKLARAIRSLERKARRLEKKSVVVVGLTREGKDRHFFQKPASDHFDLSSPAMRKSASTLAQSPKLRPAVWQVWESEPKRDQRTRRIGGAFQTFVKRKLTPFETYTCVLATASPGRVDRGPLLVRITGLVRVPNAGAGRGLNEAKKQISCRQFVDLIIPELRCEFRREAWKAPEGVSALRYWVATIAKL